MAPSWCKIDVEIGPCQSKKIVIRVRLGSVYRSETGSSSRIRRRPATVSVTAFLIAASDIDTAVTDSLKALDPYQPTREADIVDRCARTSAQLLHQLYPRRRPVSV